MTIKEIPATHYETSDGKVFPTLEEAEAHEKYKDVNVFKNWYCQHVMLAFAGGTAIIQ